LYQNSPASLTVFDVEDCHLTTLVSSRILSRLVSQVTVPDVCASLSWGSEKQS
jgi:hypothetical protein